MNLEDWYLKTLGSTTRKKLEGLKVYVVGLGTMGLEAVRLLVLLRPALLTLHHPGPPEETDLVFQEKHRLAPRLQRLKAAGGQMREEKDYRAEQVMRHDVLLICDFYNPGYLCLEKVRHGNSKIAVVLGAQMGLGGAVVSDFSHHKVFNDGVEGKTFAVKSISKGNPGVVRTQPHSLQTGDFVSIEGVMGMTQVNGKDCRPIRVVSQQLFQIENTCAFNEYLGGGLVRRVGVPALFQSFPIIDHLSDFTNTSHEEATFKCLLLALIRFHQAYDRAPAPYSEEDLDRLVQLLRKAVPSQQIDQTLFRLGAFTAGLVFQPLSWLIAGAAVFQVVKKTGLYRPLDRILYFNFFDSIQVAQTAKEYRERGCVLRPQTIRLLAEQKLVMGSFGTGEAQLLSLLLESGIGRQGRLLLIGEGYSRLMHEGQQADSYMRHLSGQFRANLLQNATRKVQYLSCELDHHSFPLVLQSLRLCDNAFFFTLAALPPSPLVSALHHLAPSMLPLAFKYQQVALPKISSQISSLPKPVTERRALKWALRTFVSHVLDPLSFLAKGYSQSDLVMRPPQQTLRFVHRCLASQKLGPLKLKFVAKALASQAFALLPQGKKPLLEELLINTLDVLV